VTLLLGLLLVALTLYGSVFCLGVAMLEAQNFARERARDREIRKARKAR